MRQIFILAIVILIAVSLLPINQSEEPAFANAVFQRLWNQHSTSPNAIDLWGSEPLLWRVEPYAEAPDGRRVVQYFDRGRMELIRSQNGSTTQVTQGLLTQEMIAGVISLGGDQIERRPPPTIPIDSGEPDSRVPTYASLQPVVQGEASDLSGSQQIVREWIDGAGVVTTGDAVESVRIAQYVSESGHNLPDVTVRLFERQPFTNRAWIESLGYPISEPYWTTYRRNGVPLPSLVQIFERRILVYTPSMAEDQQFTVANVGRHYYKWRYDTDAPAQLPNPQAGISSAQISVPSGYEAGIYARGVGTPIGLATGLGGDLWILTQEGEVHHVTGEGTDGAARDTALYATGLSNPRGITVMDGKVYVTADDGVIELPDNDGDGKADTHDYLTREIEPALGSRGAPVADESGRILVTGMELPNRDAKLVVGVEPGQEPVTILDQFSNPGPILSNKERLYVIQQDEDGAATLHRLYPGAEEDLSGTEDNIARFTPGETVTGLLIFDSELWPQLQPGTIFATVQTESGGSVVQIAPGNGAGSEITEFAKGFSKPAAMAAGIDGALYIADSGSGQVIKMVAVERQVSTR